MKKNNRTAQLLLLTVCLVCIIVIGYLAIARFGWFSKKSANDTAPQDSTESTPTTSRLIDGYFYDSAVAFSFQGEKHESPLSYTFDGKHWIWDGDADFPVNETMLYSMTYTVTNLTASRVLSADELDMTEIGLRNPTTHCTITYNDGTAFTLSFGIENTALNSVYAAISRSDDGAVSETDSTVYLVDAEILSLFQYSLLETCTADALPDFTIRTIHEMEITYPDSTVSTLTDRATAPFSAMESMAIRGVVDYKPSAEASKHYGLDDTQATTVKITYEEITNVNDSSGTSSYQVTVSKTIVLQFGAVLAKSPEYRYMTVAGTNLVFVVSSSLVDTVIGA